MKSIRLKEGKERALLRRHPWIFESAIAKGGGDAGETVRVESHDGQFLAWAALSPASKIRARAWSFDESQRIDPSFFHGACERAVRARSRFDIPSDGLRLVHGESDGLPGLIVDRYGDTLVAQFLAAGAERWKPVLADALLQATGLTRLYERSDTSSRSLEGLPSTTGWLRGEGPTRAANPRACMAVHTGHCRRAQDRLLPGPTRQPGQVRRLRGAAAVPARAQLLLLHRRVHRGGACVAAPRT